MVASIGDAVPRERPRPTRRQPRAPDPGASTPPSDRTPTTRPEATTPLKPQWRETIDSFGGFLTLGVVAAAVIAVGLAIYFSRGGNEAVTSTEVADGALMGAAIPAADPTTDRSHVANPGQVLVIRGEPPTRGPHFAVPQPTGVFKQPVPDGNAIHSLEHGIVWITYHPDKLDAGAIKQLEDIGKRYAVDTIVSPRPDNASAISIVSWGQIMSIDSLDSDQLDKFITTNRNRSPEPFVRTPGSM